MHIVCIRKSLICGRMMVHIVCVYVRVGNNDNNCCSFHQVRWTRISSSRISTRRFVVLLIDSSSCMKAASFGRAIRSTLIRLARRLCTSSRPVRSMDQSRTCKESLCVSKIHRQQIKTTNTQLCDLQAMTTAAVISAPATPISAVLHVYGLTVHAFAPPLKRTHYSHHHLTYTEHTHAHRRLVIRYGPQLEESTDTLLRVRLFTDTHTHHHRAHYALERGETRYGVPDQRRHQQPDDTVVTGSRNRRGMRAASSWALARARSASSSRSD